MTYIHDRYVLFPGQLIQLSLIQHFDQAIATFSSLLNHYQSMQVLVLIFIQFCVLVSCDADFLKRPTRIGVTPTFSHRCKASFKSGTYLRTYKTECVFKMVQLCPSFYKSKAAADRSAISWSKTSNSLWKLFPRFCSDQN
jgi:hypothetical protein